MGVSGSKGGINYKLEKHRNKKLSKRKPMFGKIFGNEHLDGENTAVATQRSSQRAPSSRGSPDMDQAVEAGLEPGTSLGSVRSSQGSQLDVVLVTSDIPPGLSRYQGSSEYLTNRNSSQDNLSRELALTSSPHYKESDMLLEDSFFGEETKFHIPLNPVNASSPNKDSNIDSERDSLNNVLDSQEFADVSSSVEDIIQVGVDLSDSGCHTSDLAANFLSSQSVNKVRLDLNQVKYVGLSLVGGADSPFGNLPVLVKEVMRDGAGERCGISRGDEIIGINNVSLEDKPLQFAVERLRQCSSRDQEIILWVIPQPDSC